MRVAFPWPPKALSPNVRVHHFEKARAVKAYRTGCAWECKAAGLGKIEADALHVSVTFFPPDRRRYDLDNLIARVKAGLDGLADVIGVDDSRWTLAIKRGDQVERGRVIVRIEKEEWL